MDERKGHWYTPVTTTASSESGGTITMRKWLLFILALLTFAGAQPSSAETPEEFYRGKQIRFIVGTAAGQEYDLWARMIARHMRRHLPGTPTIIVENMPGAGHVI